jgi:uncharacterized protein (TIRG00374 family)
VTPAPWRAIVSVVIGLALFAAFVGASDLASVGSHLRALGWSAPLVLLPYVAVNALDTIGWRGTLPASARRLVPFPQLCLTRMAGEAVNSVTPTATVGGEPVKAHLLRAFGVSVADGLASVVIARTALVASQAVFVALGAAALFIFLGRPALAVVWATGLLAATAGFVLSLIRLQQRGLAQTASRLLERLAPGSRLAARLEQGATAVDRRLLDFHDLERPAFVRASAVHLVAWGVGALEVQLMLGLIGAPIGFLEAFVIEALAQPIRAMALVVPGGLGVQEWGGMWLCTSLGMAEADAVTLWLLKRARETAFDLVGLAYLGKRTFLD